MSETEVQEKPVDPADVSPLVDQRWIERFVIQRQGKPMVLYAGLVDLATKMGLKDLRVTEILQLPTKDNGNQAIMKAICVMEKDGVTRTFEDIADAASNNVAPAMQLCLIRMCATRAKGRCLRDATNIGMVMLEELGPEAPAERTATRRSGSKDSASDGDGAAYSGGVATAPNGKPINTGTGPCPVCRCPVGKIHSTGCSHIGK